MQTFVNSPAAIDDGGSKSNNYWPGFDETPLAGVPPARVLKPGDVPDLLDIVADAARQGGHLLPVSSTGRHYRGDTLCVANTGVLDMSGFDRVVRVDRRNQVLFFEAGVDCATLVNAAAQDGLRPILPLCPRPGKSALTAMLEREAHIYPCSAWDIADPLLCAEVVFGDGNLFRTGAAAGPGGLRDQWRAGDAQKFPMGPGASDFLRVLQGAQGSFGVVTWCTAKAELLPLPDSEFLYILSADSLDKLARLTRFLLYRRHPAICFIVNDATLASLLNKPAFDEPAAWHLVFSLALPKIAPREWLDYVSAEISAECRRADIDFRAKRQSSAERDLLRIMTTGDTLENKAWWKLAGGVDTSELFFQTTLDNLEIFIQTARAERLASGNLSTAPNPMVYIQPQVGGRMCHLEFIFPREERQERQISQKQLETLALKMRQRGGFFSRPYPVFGETITEGEQSLAITKRLAAVFDPHSLFTPNGLRFLRRNSF